MIKQIKAPDNLAMTGELTLSGRVLPVGGIKEKVIAAKRVNIKHIILPAENRKDLEEIPAYIKKGLTFHFVSDIIEVLEICFKKKR
jgi:ATP-dependent Lon protease